MLVAGALLVTVVTGCGGSGNHNGHGAGTSTRATAQHNATDVAFATEMIPHHRQAVEMAQMVIDRGATPAIKALASRIKAAQGPEITTLSGFLAIFGQPVPSAGMSMPHGGHAATGMMSADDMAQLQKASGQALEKMFLEMMIRHHQGAIEMSSTELGSGTYVPARDLAATITKAQSAEIAHMASLLNR
jgi:uncharacterized protein (DUF305 family)